MNVGLLSSDLAGLLSNDDCSDEEENRPKLQAVKELIDGVWRFGVFPLFLSKNVCGYEMVIIESSPTE